MEPIVEILKQINVAQLFAMGIMIWFFYNRLEKKIEKLDEKFTGKLEKLEEKIGDIDKRLCKLEAKFDDVDRRLCRIEGSLATQGHCLYSQKEPLKKAE